MTALTFAIYLQQRDIANTILLIQQCREFFPDSDVCVFYSGVRPEMFQTLSDAIQTYRARLLVSDAPQTIGFVVNKLMREVSTEWVVLCDGDVLFTEQSLVLLRTFLPHGHAYGAIQGKVVPQPGASMWAQWDCVNDTIAYLADRTNPTAWFSTSVDSEYDRDITTLHGGVMLVSKSYFWQVGGMEPDVLLVQRALAAAFRSQSIRLWYWHALTFYHIYPNSLLAVLRRKIFHARGSAFNRLRHPELYPDSPAIRFKMFIRAFAPPPAFRAFSGRIYFCLSMLTFTLALSWYLRVLRKVRVM